MNFTLKNADNQFVTKESKREYYGGNAMVHPGMVGITELMCNDGFAGWIEKQESELLGRLSTFEIFSQYCRESAEALT